MALLKGLRLAWDVGYSKFKIHMDSQITMKKIKEPCQKNRALYFVMKEWQELMFNLAWEIKFNHCYRKANCVANHKATSGAIFSSCYF